MRLSGTRILLWGSILICLAIVAVVSTILSHDRNRSSKNESLTLSPIKPTQPIMQPVLDLGLGIEPKGPFALRGRVIGPDGRALQGAMVWIDSIPTRMTTSLPDGSFAFDGLIGRSYAVWSRCVDMVGGPQSTRVAELNMPIVVMLRKGVLVHVTVVDDTDSPLANAALRLSDNTIVTADVKGEAQFYTNPGWLSIEARAPELSARQITTVGSVGATTRITIMLTKGFRVRGRVVDNQGAPLARTRISVVQSGFREMPVEVAVSADDGVFTIPRIARGSYSLVATDGEHASTRTPQIEIVRSIDDVEIAMNPGAVYSGRVVNAVGVPIQYATVHLVQGGATARRTHTDANGLFGIAGISDGLWIVHAESDAGLSQEVIVDLSRDQYGQLLVLEHAVGNRSVIAGTVVDDVGVPGAGLVIHARMRNRHSFVMSSATSDDRGAFSIANLPAGEYMLWAGEVGSVADENRATIAEPGDESVRVVLVRKGGIKGKVIVSETSEAPVWFTVEVLPRVHDWPTLGDRDTFEINNLEQGMFTLRLKGAEFVDATKADIQVKPGRVTDVGTIMVTRGRDIIGKVVNTSGLPIAGSRVAIGYAPLSFGDDGLDERLSDVRTTVTDKAGTFALVSNTLNMGASQALFVAADHSLYGRSRPEQVELDRREITLVVHISGSISGRVIQNGKPIARAIVAAGSPESSTAITTENGTFAFSNLPDGPTVLRATLPATLLRSFSKNVIVVGGKQIDVVLDVPQGALTLTVNLKPRAGDEVSTAIVFLFAGSIAMENYRQVTAQLSASALDIGIWHDSSIPSVTFREVLPGEYTLCVVPLAGNPTDPVFMDLVRAHGETVKVFCTPTQVTSIPVEQVITIEVPAMDPFPSPE
jgi:hypothetical protein